MSDRYAKQRRFAPIGDDGQSRLREARIVIVGCGALGALAAEQLVRSGVGFVRIVDRDYVEWSNLQRQALFTEADVKSRSPKSVAAADHLRAINSEVEVEPIVADFNRHNARSLVDSTIQLVLDGTDNLETRYLINEYSLDLAVPWVYGGCVGSQGQAALFAPPHSPCLRCLFPDLPAPGQMETCDNAGVLAPAAHLVASLQVGMVLRALVEKAQNVAGKLLVADVWDGTMRSVRLPAKVGCPTCRDGERPFLSGQQGSEIAVLCGRNAVQVSPDKSGEVDIEALARRLDGLGEVTSNRFLVRVDLFVEADLSLTVFRDGRVIVQGTESPASARAIVARYLGS